MMPTIERTLLDRINAFAAAGLCLWYTLPALSGLRVVFLLLAGLWMLSARGIVRWLTTPPRPLRLFLFLPWLAVTALYLLRFPGDSEFAGRSNAVLISLFVIIFMDYYVVNGCFSLLRRLCALSLVSYLLGALWASVFVADDILTLKMAVQVQADSLFTANFGTYYAAVFVLAAGIYLLVHAKGGGRLFGVFAFGVCVSLLLRAQFTISILLALLLLVLTALYHLLRRPSVFWLISVVLLVSILLLLPEIGGLLIGVSRDIASPLISERLLDLGTYLSGSGESVHAATRLGMYEGDILNFLRYPFTGSQSMKLAGFSPLMQKGGHNSLLRLLAEYGIILSAGFLLFVFRPVAAAGRIFEEEPYHRYWQPAVTVYLILCCVNPTFNVPTLSFVMAAVMPFVGLLTMNGEQIRVLEEQYVRKQGAADYGGDRFLR